VSLVPDRVGAVVDGVWAADVVPTLHDYIRIPAKSPAFDPDWAEHGYLDEATALLRDWAAARSIPGMTVSEERLPGRTPVLLCEIPPAGGGPADDTVLLYGHLDKQPEMAGWAEGKGPWEPVLEGERLFGRGGADDGYALFAALTAVEAAQAAGASHSRLMVLIETGEESGSPDLPAYVEHLAGRLGAVSLVVCLDSGCATYDTLWVTTSLRGLVGGTLDVQVLRQGVHSGLAGGVVPSSFRLARALLSRLEDETTGKILLAEADADIPPARRREAEEAAAALGPDGLAGQFPWVGTTRPVTESTAEQILDRNWRPALAVIGVDGAPTPEHAGNVLRPGTRLKLSLRLPPTVDDEQAGRAMKSLLEDDPPNGALVTFDLSETGPGWEAPATAAWLEAALDEASLATFGVPARFQGEGGSIPFMGMLGARFPSAQFVVTGVLGPGSNAHGPNEFLDLPTARRVTGAIAHLLHSHAKR
jgi:acetylornithine deacetylase/succinyl-diaminopimelate desuccinylase-like protein